MMVDYRESGACEARTPDRDVVVTDEDVLPFNERE